MSICTRCRCITARRWTVFSTDVYLGATSIILPARTRPLTVWISLLRHPDFDSTDLSSLRKG
jgi:fatty-acyl-CoA synthase